MNFASLQQELQALPPSQQDRISAFLTSLRMRRDGSASEVAVRLDDERVENWKRWQDVKEELDDESGELDS